ncbi:NAD(+) diphosphatase [Agrilactobacillus fermenti]|uniref:NAD(+) diphosphatase n=1 Tax=Agrilactobacillus fermenti TaxID=2586909 RepID=UPI001E31BD21|nr:NUDIX domain-containing protein [Agrilactobacillus fermenti]MCD2257354.1 NUDIX domain-containing protein [Agrilactobacillus fermenti]
MAYNFCPTCGTKLILKTAGDDGKIPYCSVCERFWFPVFTDCVLVLVHNEFNEIALAKMPYLSEKYESLISGYMQVGETAETAAAREVEEELGITELTNLHFTGTYWFHKTGVLMHGFIALAKKQKLTLSSELTSAEWVPVDKVPNFLFPDSSDNAAFAIYRHYLQEIKSNINHKIV